MTTVPEHQRFSYKRAYLRNLMLLACADGALNDIERSLLLRIGEKIGVQSVKVKEILQENDVHDIMVPEFFSDKMNHLFDLLQILYADGHVSPNELDFLRSVVFRFDMNIAIVDQLVYLFRFSTPSEAEWKEFVNNTVEGLQVAK